MWAIDPDKGAYVFATGRKGSGKSVLCRRLFDAFPYDRLVIDPTGDVTAQLRDEGVEVVKLAPGGLPLKFPRRPDENERPVTAVFVPDMGSPQAVDDTDRALGLALANTRTCVWIDEIGTMTGPSSTPPNLKRALHHGRHDELTLIMAGPRPIAIDPLVLAQSDFVAVFAVPNPRDRQRIADEVGIPPREFDALVHSLKEFEYLWIDVKEHDIYHYPPLPPRKRNRLPADVGYAL